MDIHELIKKSGVSRRTIYYYIQLGLLPPPRGKGKNYEYTEEHLKRLRLIKSLQESRLSLKEIKSLLEGKVYANKWAPLEERHINEVHFPFGKSTESEARKALMQWLSQVSPSQKFVFKITLLEKWVRHKLTDGLELHIRLPLTEEAEKILKEKFGDVLETLKGGEL